MAAKGKPFILNYLQIKNSGEPGGPPRQGVHQLSTSYGSNSLKSDAVVQEKAVVLPAGIPDTVPDVKNTVLGQRESQSRSKVTESVGTAQPIGHEADFGMKRLFESDDRPCFVSQSIIPAEQTIGANCHTRPITTLDLLANVGINEAEGIYPRPVRHREVGNASESRRQPFIFIVIELIFEVRLQLNRIVRCSAIGEREIEPDLDAAAEPKNRARNIRLKTPIGMTFKMADEVEFDISLPLRHNIGARDRSE